MTMFETLAWIAIIWIWMAAACCASGLAYLIYRHACDAAAGISRWRERRKLERMLAGAMPRFDRRLSVRHW